MLGCLKEGEHCSNFKSLNWQLHLRSVYPDSKDTAMIYLTEISLHWYEVITFQWQTSVNQSPCDTVLRFRSINFKLWEQILNPALGLPESQPTCGQLSVCAVQFFQIKYVLLWDNFAEQVESNPWPSLLGSWALLFLGLKSKVRSLLVCPLPVCNESLTSHNVLSV